MITKSFEINRIILLRHLLIVKWEPSCYRRKDRRADGRT